jgi:copper chaperone CopZ
MSNTLQLKITGMSCQHCVINATKKLQDVVGVSNVVINLESGLATVSGIMDQDQLLMAIIDAGYQAELTD